MPRLVGVAGLAGAGKTTAVDYLAGLAAGHVLYLGQAVIDEVRARGLEETRENERLIRIELRESHGRAVLAVRSRDKAAALLRVNTPVFVDAILLMPEYDALRGCTETTDAHLLAINASFETRLSRLTLLCQIQ